MPTPRGRGTAVQDQELQPCKSPEVTSPRITLDVDEPSLRVWTVTTTIRCTADRHDTMTAYKNHRCRCPEATRKVVDYDRRRDAGLVHPSQPATMTMRRLQALATLGWPADQLAPLIKRNPVSVSQIRRGAHQMVTGTTALAVHQVYRRLHKTAGPSDRTRAYAARQGWTLPSPVLMFLDIDEVAVARACAGARVELTRGERLDAVYRLRVHRGLGYDAIAELLHVAQRQVHRDLADLGLIGAEAGAA